MCIHCNCGSSSCSERVRAIAFVRGSRSCTRPFSLQKQRRAEKGSLEGGHSNESLLRVTNLVTRVFWSSLAWSKKMSQRATYPAPTTPSYLGENENDFNTEGHSAIPRQADGSPRLGSGSSPQFGTRLGPNDHYTSTHSGRDTASALTEPESSFPPATRTYVNGTSRPNSVHVPLLSAVDDNGDHLSQREVAPLHRRRPSQMLSYFVWRSRLHPVMLFPAFVFGIFLAMSGVFGPSMIPRTSFSVCNQTAQVESWPAVLI